MKKKKKVIIWIIIGITLIIGLIIGFKYYENETIKKSYTPYAITKNKTSLYNSKKKEIGTIEKDISLELEKENETSKYFKIKNTSYFIYYKDIKKRKEIKEAEKDYIPFNNNIKTNKKISLLQNNKEKIILNNGINTPIEYEDENNYYIIFQKQLFAITKNSKVELIENENTQEEISNHVSVIYYESIQPTCNSKTCTTNEEFTKQISQLKENGYYSIKKEQYEKYLKGYIHLKKGAIYFITKTPLEEIQDTITDLNIQIDQIQEEVEVTNKTTTPGTNSEKIECYQIKSYSTIENIIKMANGEEVSEVDPDLLKKTNTTSGEQGVAVLNYHFFYGPGEDCSESICLDIAIFKQHLAYLKENGFKTLTMEEFRKWMYGEIEVPQKSVLITIDDGAKGTGKHNGNKLIPALEEYQMHATLFLITGWWAIDNYQSEYLDIQSHTHDMHQYGSCGRGQINCATYEEALADLRQSLAVVKNNDSFCFPFYYYSDTSLQAVKDAGFKLSFVGGNRKAKRSDNKYLVPRYPIHSNITMDRFINIVN